MADCGFCEIMMPKFSNLTSVTKRMRKFEGEASFPLLYVIFLNFLLPRLLNANLSYSFVMND